MLVGAAPPPKTKFGVLKVPEEVVVAAPNAGLFSTAAGLAPNKVLPELVLLGCPKLIVDGLLTVVVCPKFSVELLVVLAACPKAKVGPLLVVELNFKGGALVVALLCPKLNAAVVVTAFV